MTPEGNAQQIADDIRDEALQLGTAAVTSGLPLRLIGGLAIWATSPTVRRPPFARDYPDLDLVADSRRVADVKVLLADSGYVPERLFNAIHGARRLNFGHPTGRWTADVLLDELRMSHAITLRGRLATPGPTIDLADLLLTKLQIWEINSKDLGDIAALLADHELVQAGGHPTDRAIDLDRIASLASNDWGLEHTLERNLRLVDGFAGRITIEAAPRDPQRQVATLLASLTAAPKSLGWRARARIGERVRWYETPEEVRHHRP